MPNDVIREPFEGVIGPVVVDAGAGAVGPLEREDPVVAGVVKDDLFMRESVKTMDVWMGPEVGWGQQAGVVEDGFFGQKSVWISTDVWMGPETEVGWDQQAGVVKDGFFVRKCLDSGRLDPGLL